MRNRGNHSTSRGAVRSGAHLVVIAIIFVKTLDAVMRVIVKTTEGLRESRRTRRA